MTIKNPVTSYGTAHDELKAGDLISGKSIQLSNDQYNSLSVGNDGGVYGMAPTRIIGAGMVLGKSFKPADGSSYPTIYLPLFKNTIDIMDSPSLPRKSYLAMGTCYLVTEYEQNIGAIASMDFHQHWQRNSANDYSRVPIDGQTDKVSRIREYETHTGWYPYKDMKKDDLSFIDIMNSEGKNERYKVLKSYDLWEFKDNEINPGRVMALCSGLYTNISNVPDLKCRIFAKYTIFEIPVV